MPKSNAVYEFVTHILNTIKLVQPVKMCPLIRIIAEQYIYIYQLAQQTWCSDLLVVTHSSQTRSNECQWVHIN